VPWAGEAVRPGAVGHGLVDQMCPDIPAAVFDAEADFCAELTGWGRQPGSLPEFDFPERPAAAVVVAAGGFPGGGYASGPCECGCGGGGRVACRPGCDGAAGVPEVDERAGFGGPGSIACRGVLGDRSMRFRRVAGFLSVGAGRNNTTHTCVRRDEG
jgi:hypothetical protein